MPEITFAHTSAFVSQRAELDDLPRITDAAKQRKATLRTIRSAAVAVGTTIRVDGMSPKYLNGLVGQVESIEPGKRTNASIRLDAAVSKALHKASRGHYGTNDGSTYLLTGIPLTGCNPSDSPASQDPALAATNRSVDAAELAGITLVDVLGYIASQATGPEVETYFAAAHSRHKALMNAQREHFASLVAKDQTVTLADLSKHYYIGLTGTVEKVIGSGLQGKADVLLDEKSTETLRFWSALELRPGVTRHTVRIPLSSCRATS